MGNGTETIRGLTSQVKICVSGKTVISSGSVFTPGNEEDVIKFELDLKYDTLILTLILKEDPNSASSIQCSVDEHEGITLVCQNFRAYGNCPVEFIELGSYDDSKLYFFFNCKRYGSENMISKVDYCFYIEAYESRSQEIEERKDDDSIV